MRIDQGIDKLLIPYALIVENHCRMDFEILSTQIPVQSRECDQIYPTE
jgi:hypothetical protein